jgi:hypothetical protein
MSRPAAGDERRTALGRIIGGIDDVLDRDRNAVQRPDRVPLLAALIEPACLGERMLAVEMGERLDLSIERRDAIEASTRTILG